MIFKEFTQDILVNGLTVTAKVSVEIDEDGETNPDFDFGNAEENAAYLARFNRGDLFIGVITVTASAEGMTGTDALGGCHLSCNDMYDSNPFNESVNETLRSYTMVEQALADLEANIVATARSLTKYA